MALSLYNSLTRKEEEFKPINSKHVKMYVCGPTVYDRAHLGNARSVVVYDVLYRVLKNLYPKITYVRNITDVDDKIIKAAKDNKESIDSLTGRMIGHFHEDMEALNILPPSYEPRATENIEYMVEMIKRLIERGFAYVTEKHVLFEVEKYKDYGHLSKRSSDEMIAGARVEVAPYKKKPGDFVLWKPANEGDDPSCIFDSPWGEGRPGWHIECSAMSLTFLRGEFGAESEFDFDIHGGGSDLMFPHHENEIAQSCCAYDNSHYARYWVHNGFLTVNGEKMSKSLGNFFTVRELLDKGIKGEVIRYAFLTSHYRSPLDWTDKLIEDSQKSMDYFYNALKKVKDIKEIGGVLEASNSPVKYLEKDMNISGCFAEMHRLAKQVMSETDNKKAVNSAQELKFYGYFLGLLEQNPEEWFKTVSESDILKIEELIEARIQAKKSKDYKKADEIRKQLTDMGIALEDKPDGTTDWKK